jgi:hypothetical protein
VTDIEQVFQECHVSYVTADDDDHHASRGWVNVVCPHCSPSSDRYRLGFNTHGRYFSCWVCGYLPTVPTLAELTGLPYKECSAILGELGSSLSRPRKERKAGKFSPPFGLEPHLPNPHRQYLIGRGFLPSQVISLWDVGGIGLLGGNLRWRLYIPIYLHGRPVSWTTRKLGDGEPRYLTATDAESDIVVGDLLYGIDHCRNSVVIVEGPLDAWAIGPGSVALMGMHLSPCKLEALSRFPSRVVCFDSEPEAQQRARKLCNDLSVFDGVTTNVILETGKDPASAVKGEVQYLREQFLR